MPERPGLGGHATGHRSGSNHVEPLDLRRRPRRRGADSPVRPADARFHVRNAQIDQNRPWATVDRRTGVPIYSLYWVLILLPQEVTKAKQMRGIQAPTRNIVLYLFLLNFALASDLNDLAR